MKKWTTALLCLILCGAGNQALATSLLSSTDPIHIGNTLYTITDQHRASSDAWLSNLHGYRADDGAFSGLYLGTVTGITTIETNKKANKKKLKTSANDDPQDIRNLIEYFLEENYEVGPIEKIEAEDTSHDFLNLTYATDDKSGRWSTKGSQGVDFYTVKGGNEFALYYLDPASNNGQWITDHLLNGGGNIPGISHLSVVTATSPSPVPEPASLILLGLGIIAMTGWVKKGRKKRTVAT